MRNTKFVVVKLRELLKTAVFAILGVIILLGLIHFFLHMGSEESAGGYRDGTYEAELSLGAQQASVQVEIADGKITDVAMIDEREAIAVLYPAVETAMEEVRAQVLQKQSAEGVTVSSQHTYSAQVLLDGIAACVEEAQS